jgi:nucleoside 2-deoxyribosyltransferase
MKRDILVYISGPMTAKDGRSIEQNVADGVAVYLELLKLGIPAFSPHLSGLAPSAWTALSHAEWIDYDCRILDRCTHVLMMERWDTSAGALYEAGYAARHGMPIAHSVPELCEMVGVER